MILVFLANGFEEIEALTPVDMLRRAGSDVKTVSITDSKTVTGSHGIPVEADLTIKEIPSEIPELVILPGGMPGAKNLRASETVCNTVINANKSGKYIAAICAAPFIFGQLGLLEGKKATCYPGFENELKGAKVSKKHVVTDGNIITAAGMGAALEFSAALIEVLFGKEKANSILKSIISD